MSAATEQAQQPFPPPTIGHRGKVRPSAGGQRVEAFASQFCRHSKGRWRGRPLLLEPFQQGFVHEAFRTLDGRRVYHEALLGLPRKNGKSTLAAMLALYMLLLDGEPAPEVYSAAGDRNQARIVFGEAARMVRRSPELSEWCRVLKNEIVVDSTDGLYKAVSADAGLQHGSNPSAAIIDELHVHKDRDLYDALTTGMDARENPLALSITTAGFDPENIEREVFERGLKGDDPRMLMWWYGAQPAREEKGRKIRGDDVTSPAVWEAANPAPWITVDRLERAYRRFPASVFARLHLNMHTEAEELWLPPGAWEACEVPEVIDLEGERVWIGVDIGLRHDRSAIVEVNRRPGPTFTDDRGRERPGPPIVKAKGYLFEPAEEGGILDLEPVENKLLELGRARQVETVYYDPHFFARSAEDLADRLPMVEYPMQNVNVVPASQALYEVILERRLEHDGDPTLAAHVKAAAVRETDRGWRIAKSKAKNPMDMLTALLLAIAGALEPEGTGVDAVLFP